MKVHSQQEIDVCVDSEGDGSGELPELLIAVSSGISLTLPCCYIMPRVSRTHEPSSTHGLARMWIQTSASYLGTAGFRIH